MKKTYEYRIYPSDEQKVLLAKNFGCARWIYNFGLSKKIEHYKQTQKSLSRYDIQNEIPKLKKEKSTCWLKEVNSQSLQAVLFHLDTAYSRFFKKQGGFPKFKSRKSKQSFEIPQSLKIDFDEDYIKIPKFKEPIKTIFHRKFEGKIGTCHIKCSRSGSYYVTILIEDGRMPPVKSKIEKKTSIGIDVGIKSFAVTSNGETIENPRHLINNQRRLNKIQRAFSRKIKKNPKSSPLSNNAEKQKLNLQKLHERVAWQRKDFLHKVSAKLICENQTICVEDLNVIKMLKNRYLSKHIQDLGLGMFFGFLRYKADWYGKNVLTIGRFEPSSKTCSVCGYIKHDLTLKYREWACSRCSSHHDRDVNASINIRDFSFVNINENDNTESTRNTQKSKPTSYGTSLETSVGRSYVSTIKASQSLVEG